MTWNVHRLHLPLVFPEGIAPGEGSDYNTLLLARNGNGEPVLRGTALAGSLRHAWRRFKNQQSEEPGAKDIILNVEIENYFFGTAADKCGESDIGESALQVCDTVLDTGKALVGERTHHLRNRHTGVVSDGGLFSVESCPVGTKANVTLWLIDRTRKHDAKSFLAELAGLLNDGCTLGGNAARGIGFAELGPDGAKYHSCDLAEVKQHAQYLSDHRKWREKPEIDLEGENPAPQELSSKRLELTLSFRIPQGQDLLVGDGQGLDRQAEPQRTIDVEGKPLWRIPGATLRGTLHSWCSRLATKENFVVSDSVESFQGSRKPYRETDIKAEDLAKCPIHSLFGSVYAPGRIHVRDALAPASKSFEENPEEEQVRMHVVIDALSGGAAESLLFDNTVLTSELDSLFTFRVRIDNPKEDEVKWIAKTIKAIHLGVLRIGSSKSAGRLALDSYEITGTHKEHAKNILKECIDGNG